MSDTKPISTLRLGALNAAIWKNEATDGTWYNVTLERRYYDEQAKTWKSTASYGRDDLLPLGKLLDLAHTEIHELQTKDREAANQASGTQAAAKSAGRSR